MYDMLKKQADKRQYELTLKANRDARETTLARIMGRLANLERMFPHNTRVEVAVDKNRIVTELWRLDGDNRLVLTAQGGLFKLGPALVRSQQELVDAIREGYESGSPWTGYRWLDPKDVKLVDELLMEQHPDPVNPGPELVQLKYMVPAFVTVDLTAEKVVGVSVDTTGGDTEPSRGFIGPDFMDEIGPGTVGEDIFYSAKHIADEKEWPAWTLD